VWGRYRAITPKARLIPLSQPFLSYLRADGIIIPPEDPIDDSDGGTFSDASSASDEHDSDPADHFRDIHNTIKDTIKELGGSVAPKLNWSAPKDAVWMSATNSMECQCAGDIYLLLKSSDFITHDLECAYDDAVDDNPFSLSTGGDSSTPNCSAVEAGSPSKIPYNLVLRKWVFLNPSLEFRCFVRARRLIAICQRDLNHFDFLFSMADSLRARIQDFFEDELKTTFPDANFVFDVYIPPPQTRVWLIDINPWAQRTDPLLFSWLEILTMPVPLPPLTDSLRASTRGTDQSSTSDSEDAEREAEDVWQPELRLVKRDDPEAYGFTTPQYSAHKLPRDVVDATTGGPGPLREFADCWKNMLEKQRNEEQQHQSDDDDDDGDDVAVA
jgi:hypothetical protein